MNIKRLKYEEVFELVFNDVDEIMDALHFGNDTINSIVTEQIIELEVKNKTVFSKEIIQQILSDSENDIRSWYANYKAFLMQGQYRVLQNEIIYNNMKNTIFEILEKSYN